MQVHAPPRKVAARKMWSRNLEIWPLFPRSTIRPNCGFIQFIVIHLATRLQPINPSHITWEYKKGGFCPFHAAPLSRARARPGGSGTRGGVRPRWRRPARSAHRRAWRRGRGRGCGRALPRHCPAGRGRSGGPWPCAMGRLGAPRPRPRGGRAGRGRLAHGPGGRPPCGG